MSLSPTPMVKQRKSYNQMKTSGRFSFLASCVILVLVLLGILSSIAEETTNPKTDAKSPYAADELLRQGIFPPEGTGTYIEGDLVINDPVNRRGAIREKRHFPRHYFAMLPYGMVRYHGAPADLCDIPPGTHMHGKFLVPLEGEQETIPVSEKVLKEKPHYRNNHAILLEDDVSFKNIQKKIEKLI